MRASSWGLVWALCAGGASAQSFDDFTLVRNRPVNYGSVVKARAGVAAAFANSPDPSIGHEDNTGIDGFAYYRNDRFTSNEAILDAYAGRDGTFVGLRENTPGEGGNRVELTARYFPFYREGFYRSGNFIPTGRYEGYDYGAYAGAATVAAEALTLEAGAFYRRYTFDRDDDTSSTYVVPEDYNGYGIRLFAEHNTLTLDRTYGLPHDGFIMTLMVERELNDSDGTFGTPIYMSGLPSAVWRLLGHLEWFHPESDLGVWSFRLDGAWLDENDRVYAAYAQKPIGFLWGDAEIGFRFQFGDFRVTPFVEGQYIKALEENGVSSNSEVFYGGGARLAFDLSENVSLYADYSYLTNPSRPPVSLQEDTWGEQALFAGVEVMFGGQH